MAGDGAYDIFAAYSRTIAACAANSLTTDISYSKYIDFDNPWWQETLVEESMIGDNLYFISGDISTNVLYMMYASRTYIISRYLRKTVRFLLSTVHTMPRISCGIPMLNTVLFQYPSTMRRRRNIRRFSETRSRFIPCRVTAGLVI